MPNLNAIPCNLITGFLGVGKTTCILSLLKQKPKHERWALLVNEFGEIGLDGKLLEQATDNNSGIFIREVPGGCMCCSSGTAMQVALNMLLMKARPQRLLIEPTGLGHPEQILKLLKNRHYQDVLSLQNTLTLVNPKHFGSARHINNEIFQQQLSVADVVVINKADLATADELLEATRYLESHDSLKLTRSYINRKGELPLVLLDHPAADMTRMQRNDSDTPRAQQQHTHVHRHHTGEHRSNTEQTSLPACGYIIKRHHDQAGSSVGWRVDKKWLFDQTRLKRWFGELNAIRIKALVNTQQGWIAFNLCQESDLQDSLQQSTFHAEWHAGEDLMESRLEIIFEPGHICEQAIADWQHCLISDTVL
jgi:G3E family GTPase